MLCIISVSTSAPVEEFGGGHGEVPSGRLWPWGNHSDMVIVKGTVKNSVKI